MKIAIGSDHAGFELKQQLVEALKSMGHEVKDYGTHSKDSVDYPDFAHPVANDISNDVHDKGILVCGSGNGVCIAANKHQSVRAALCWNEELAALARQHNDANILCVPARFISEEEAVKMVRTFLETSFEGGRHGLRVDKIALY